METSILGLEYIVNKNDVKQKCSKELKQFEECLSENKEIKCMKVFNNYIKCVEKENKQSEN